MKDEAKYSLVVIHAVAFSGTSWLSYVIGSHPRMFTLGNPDYAIRRIGEFPGNVCMIHQEDCSVWPNIISRYSSNGNNLFEAIAKTTGRDVIVVANPHDANIRLQVEECKELFEFHLTRDLRALCASYGRKNPELTVIEVVKKWLWGGARFKPRYFGDTGKVVRYEDTVKDPSGILGEIGGFHNVGYDIDATQYWNFEHHHSGGNGMTARGIRLKQGLEKASDDLADYYAAVSVSEKGNVIDDRWRNELSEDDIYLIDRILGDVNLANGYEKWEFDPKAGFDLESTFWETVDREMDETEKLKFGLS